MPGIPHTLSYFMLIIIMGDEIHDYFHFIDEETVA
jgi:hypothetical protein